MARINAVGARLRALHSSFAVVLALAAGMAVAHGYWPPKHGGIMSEGGEITMELVQRASDLVVHVDDHGEPVNLSGAEGVLDVTGPDGATQQMRLNATGGNSARGVGDVALSPGSRLVVTFSTKNGLVYMGRFRIRAD